jgi:hypothetical protein
LINFLLYLIYNRNAIVCNPVPTTERTGKLVNSMCRGDERSSHYDCFLPAVINIFKAACRPLTQKKQLRVLSSKQWW